jgi:hypothetical protein
MSRATYGWSTRPAGAARRGEARRRATLALAVIAAGIAAIALMKTVGEARATAPLALAYGDAGQHQCGALVGRTIAATNQVDFDLRAAEALRHRCLEYRDGELTTRAPAVFGHIVGIAKAGSDER